MTRTALDLAHAAQADDPDNTGLRLRFFDRFADAEVFLLLSEEPTAETIKPQVFPVEDQPFVLIFDLEERLAEFAGDTAHYAAMSGRAAISLLAPQALGIGFNLEVAPSSELMPPSTVAWFAETLAHNSDELSATPIRFDAPTSVPEPVLDALSAKLASASGFAAQAGLCFVTYSDNSTGHMLAFIDAHPAAEAALVKSVSEALVYSGQEAGSLDVTFLASGSTACSALLKTALVFDIPEPVVPSTTRPAPGSDLNAPPKLR